MLGSYELLRRLALENDKSSKRYADWSLKISIVAIVLSLVASTIQIYFAWPKTENRELLSKNQLLCSQTEAKILAKYKEQLSPDTKYITSTNHFNRNLNKCVVEVSSGGNDNPRALSTLSIRIYDAFENKGLVGCTPLGQAENDTYCFNISNNGVVGDTLSKTQFEIREKKYMTE